MTSTPQTDSRLNGLSFSAAWSAFAQARKAAQASALEADDARDAERATPPEIPPAPGLEKPVQKPPVLKQPVATPPVADLAEALPDAGRGFAAALSAAPEKPGVAEKCFNGLSYAAFLALPLLLLAQFAGGLATLAPWLFPQEADFARSYELMVASGNWLIAPAALPPVWFWVLRLLNMLPYVDGPVVYAAGAAFAGVLTLLATWFLALSAGYDRRTAFAAGLTLLSCLAFPALAHRVGPELLFTGLLTMGLACLIRGWNKDLSFLWLPLGYAFVALAGLAHGIFGIMLPVLGTLVFLAWKGAFERSNRADAVIGFVVLLALPLAWLGAAMLFGPGDAPLLTLCKRLIAPFLPPYWPPKDPVWLYAAALPAALAPWMLVPLFVAWGSALSRPLALLASTRKENSGSAWIWIHLVAGMLLLSAMSSKFCLDVLPLMPLLAVVLGKAVVNLPRTNSRIFFLVLAGLCGLAALALGLISLAQVWPLLRNIAPLPYPQGFAAIQGLPILAGICLLTALTLWKLVDRRFPGACLLVCAVAATVLCLPVLKLTSPSMQDIFLDKPTVPQSVPAAPAPTPPVVQVPPEHKQAAPAAPHPAPEPHKAAHPAPHPDHERHKAAHPAPEQEKAAPAAPQPAPEQHKAAPQPEESPAKNP